LRFILRMRIFYLRMRIQYQISESDPIYEGKNFFHEGASGRTVSHSSGDEKARVVR